MFDVSFITNYNKLLIHILAEAQSLGFKVGILVAGHYPLIDHARAAVLHFNQRRTGIFRRMIAWAFVDYLLVSDLYECAGDHAGGWETSKALHRLEYPELYMGHGVSLREGLWKNK